jgi:hypothetical protein
MSNELTTTRANDDGWNDESEDTGDSDHIIQGQLLKFSEGTWQYGQDATVYPERMPLVALATAAAWVRWEDNKPAQYDKRAPNTPWKERHELGFEDETKWALGPDGKTLRDPWQKTKFVYLMQPETSEIYTYSTSSWSGQNAVYELAGQIARKRYSGIGVVPLVELTRAPMKTKFGKKWKPVFKVLRWVNPDGSAPEQTAPPLQAPAQPMKTINNLREMSDEIPF